MFTALWVRQWKFLVQIQIWWIFLTGIIFLSQKLERLDCETWNSWRQNRPFRKKHLEITFFTVQPFIVKCAVSRLPFNWSLNFIQILPAACLNWYWVYVKSFFFSWLCSTGPQIYIKSETVQRTISKYFLWNNHTERKWALWWKYSYFLSSLTHSALAVKARVFEIRSASEE